MFSLGFDTLIIDNLHYSDDELSKLFELFVPLDVVNFVFIHDFDFRSDNLTLSLNKFRSYAKHLSSISPRNVHVKVCANLPLIDDAVDNPALRRLRASNKHNSIFVSIPLFQESSDNHFAANLNKLLYRKNLFPIFTSYDNRLKTASGELDYKLLCVKNCAFAFDINYLLSSENSEIHNLLISKSIHFLPSISRDLGNYVGVIKYAEHLMSVIGKSNYYKLCSLINKTATHLGF